MDGNRVMKVGMLSSGCTPKGTEKPSFNHNTKFDTDEDALLVAAKAVGQIVCSMQESNSRKGL